MIIQHKTKASNLVITGINMFYIIILLNHFYNYLLFTIYSYLLITIFCQFLTSNALGMYYHFYKRNGDYHHSTTIIIK